MNDIHQLGEMLQHYAQSEARKKQVFESRVEVWTLRISELFDRIVQWLEPIKSPHLLEVQREPYIASGAGVSPETSPFKTEKLAIYLLGKPVEFVPEVMGPDGSISLSVMGLTAARYGSVSLVCQAQDSQWQWRKANGLKDPDCFVFDADFLAQQLQGLIPRERG